MVKDGLNVEDCKECGAVLLPETNTDLPEQNQVCLIV